MTKPLVIIATRNFEKYSETFVRRHVGFLFGGNTAVIAFERPKTVLLDRPFYLAKPIRTADLSLGLLRAGGRAIRNAARIQGLIRFLEHSGATHLLCEFGYVAADLEKAIARAPIPVFCYFRGSDATKKLADPAYVAALKRTMPHLAGVIAVSRFLVERLERAGISHDKVAIIPSGTDTDLVRPGPSEGAQIVTIGRLVDKKDPLTAVSAFARVAAAHPDARWTIVGEGPLEPALRACIAAEGLSGRVEFRGALPHDAAMDLLRGAQIYFQAFREAPDGDCEGLPSVLQEALAAGKPIVTTRHAGIPEIVTDGVSGLLFAEGDAEGLAQGLDLLLSDAGLRARLGAAARSHAERHLDYRDLYRRLEAFLLAGSDNANAGPRAAGQSSWTSSQGPSTTDSFRNPN